MKKVYLAGPDVFRPDAKEYGEKLKAICLEHDLEGLYPLDNVIPPCKCAVDTARSIYYANIGLIEKADGVIANMQWFRGPSMDIGTGYEMGYGNGYEDGFNAAVNKFLEHIPKNVLEFSNKPVVGYRDEPWAEYKDYVVKDFHLDGWAVEDFGITDNLMVWMSPSRIVQSFEVAVRTMVEILNV